MRVFIGALVAALALTAVNATIYLEDKFTDGECYLFNFFVTI